MKPATDSLGKLTGLLAVNMSDNGCKRVSPNRNPVSVSLIGWTFHSETSFAVKLNPCFAYQYPLNVFNSLHWLPSPPFPIDTLGWVCVERQRGASGRLPVSTPERRGLVIKVDTQSADERSFSGWRWHEYRPQVSCRGGSFASCILHHLESANHQFIGGTMSCRKGL